MATGTPASRPAAPPRARLCSSARASASACSGAGVAKAWSRGSVADIAARAASTVSTGETARRRTASAISWAGLKAKSCIVVFYPGALSGSTARTT